MLYSVATTNKVDAYLNTLKEIFALDQFRQGQREIISAILEKKDVLAVLPTGGGKSLCYQFPAVYTNQLVIVISPLIALMKDQVDHLSRQGIPAACLYGSQPETEKKKIFSEMAKGGSFLLYMSPERAQKDGFKNWILKQKIALFAIDEAHCVSQWGHDFREEYGQLSILKKLRPDVPILALTASATPYVLQDIAKNLHSPKAEKMVHGFYRSNLYYQVETCSNEEEKLALLIQSIEQFKDGRILVYCGTRKTTEEISSLLLEKFSSVDFYHAGMSIEDRTKTQDDYIKGKIRILVATNAFGMGMDQADVRLVVHYQMPANIDSLYQEMGRAGRDGLDSTCLMLYSKKDKGLQSYFIQTSNAPYNIKDARYRNLEILVDYSEGSECRHAEILTYYKDSKRIVNCGHCDNCNPSSNRKIQKPNLFTKIKSKLKKSKVNHANLDEKEEILFQELKKWRKQTSIDLDVPAFVVLSDKTLKDIAKRKPKTLSELNEVHGIGEHKLEKYGWDILAELGGQ